VKKVWKLVNIWRRYKAYKNVSIFWSTLYNSTKKICITGRR